ncbi:MAG: phosphate uptake regulator PhoU [Candidatus Micrarchaeia archaeon]|jgi:phosphate uptake regulator
MHERKLQFTGGSSFITSLPKEWVSRQKLKAGSTVYLAEQKDGTLRLSAKHAKDAPREVTVSSRTVQGTLRNIIAAYIAGADTIVVKGKDTAAVCEEARLRVSGLEIVDEREGSTVLRVLVNAAELNFAALLKRLFLVSEVMCNLAVRSMRTGEDLSIEAKRRDNDADRLYLLIMRCLYNAPGPNSPMKAIAAVTIERISDHAEKICACCKCARPNPVFSSLLAEMLSLYSDTFGCVMDVCPNEDLFERQDILLKGAQKRAALLISSEKNKKRALALQEIWESCLRIMHYSLNLSEIAANMKYLGETSQD